MTPTSEADGSRLRRLGDRRVHPIGVGGAKLSLLGTVDDRVAQSLIETAIASGVTLLDTAAAYVPVGDEGHNERLMARAVRASGRSDIVIATKGGQARTGHRTFAVDGRPATLRRQVDASLAALGTDRIDLYFLHQLDPAVAIEESVGALAELRDEGKIEAVGVSNVGIEHAERAQAVTALAAVENSFSALDQSSADVLAWCGAHNVAFLAYSPLGGWGRPVLSEALPSTTAIARRRGVSTERLLLAWLLGVSPALLPVVGMSRRETLLDSVAASDLVLSQDERATVDREVASRVTPPSP